MDPGSVEKLVVFPGVHVLVPTTTLSPPLICGAGKCGWEKMDSKCFIFFLSLLVLVHLMQTNSEFLQHWGSFWIMWLLWQAQSFKAG